MQFMHVKKNPKFQFIQIKNVSTIIALIVSKKKILLTQIMMTVSSEIVILK